MKNKGIYIIIGIILLVTVGLLFIPTTRHYVWDIDKYPTSKGEQPYDMKLFDELLRRSLPNGYSTKELQVLVNPDSTAYIWNNAKVYDLPEISKASADTSFIVTNSYSWRAIQDGYFPRFSQIYSLLRHAQGGGKSLLLITRKPHDYEQSDLSVTFNELGITSCSPDLAYEEATEYIGGHSYYPNFSDVEWLQERPYKPLTLGGPQTYTITIDNRFTTLMFTRYPDPATAMLPMSERIDGHGYECIVEHLLINENDPGSCYAIDICYPKTGGHVYVSTLGPYFTNLGVATKGSEKLIKELVSKIDDRHVTRLTYPKNVRAPHNYNKKGALAKIEHNKALSMTWNLLLLLMALLLVRGLMRRYPVNKEANELDKTDPVAVREYKFRNSPLLHFLYQCSWLYKGTSNYEDLFRINYRRLCRAVNRKTGVELKTAKRADIRRAAETLAAIQVRDVNDIINELTWMHDANAPGNIKVNSQQFIYSQQIVEKYARDTF